MLYPAMSELLKHVDSRYLLVNVVAHRARQISIEERASSREGRYRSAKSKRAH